MKFLALFLALLGCALPSAQAQIIFPPQADSGDVPHTNVLTGIPDMGILLIDFDFFQTPDRMDVYFGETQIFTSGFTNGPGQFVIPYGSPSIPSPSLTILMNANGPVGLASAWEYAPSVVPVPEPGVWYLAGAGLLAMGWRRAATRFSSRPARRG